MIADMDMGGRCRKRKREKESEGEGEKESRLSTGSYQVLVEILIRLPSNKYAHQCKLVCKRWNSNICSRYFEWSFNWYHGHSQKGEVPKSFTLVFDSDRLLSMDGESNIVRHLVLPPDLNQSNLAVQAVYRDLLLFSRDKDLCTHQLFVINLVTRRFIALPLLPPTGREIRTRTFSRSALLFDSDSEDLLLLSSSSRLKVIRILCFTPVAAEIQEAWPIPHADFSVQIFSSDTNQWIQYNVDWYPFKWTLLLNEIPIISHNGMFHWLNPTSLVSLNPCHLVVDHHQRLQLNRTVDLPDKSNTLLGFGVSGDHLNVITLMDHDGSRSLCMWQLQEAHKTSPAHWTLLHKLQASKLRISLRQLSFKFLAFHPYETHTLYAQVDDVIYLINLGTSRSKKCGRLPYDADKVRLVNRAVPPLMHYWFPTCLIQPLPNSRA